MSASDPWRIPASQWSQSDVERLLNDSPWAVRTDATMDDPAERREADPSPLPTASQSGMEGRSNPGATPRWDGGIGKNRRGQLATIPVIVRWDSAAIVRHALEYERQHDPATPATPQPAADGAFILTVIGLLPAKQATAPATLQTKSSSDDGTRTAQTTEELLEWFMTNARLLVKGEPALQPQNVRVDQDTGVVHLFFKRSELLAEHRRDVLLVTRFGSMNVQAKFRTKDMVVDGHPDL